MTDNPHEARLRLIEIPRLLTHLDAAYAVGNTALVVAILDQVSDWTTKHAADDLRLLMGEHLALLAGEDRALELAQVLDSSRHFREQRDEARAHVLAFQAALLDETTDPGAAGLDGLMRLISHILEVRSFDPRRQPTREQWDELRRAFPQALSQYKRLRKAVETST